MTGINGKHNSLNDDVRCVGAWVRGCVGARVRGCVGTWVRGCVGAWLRGCVGAWVCRLSCSASSGSLQSSAMTESAHPPIIWPEADCRVSVAIGS